MFILQFTASAEHVIELPAQHQLILDDKSALPVVGCIVPNLSVKSTNIVLPEEICPFPVVGDKGSFCCYLIYVLGEICYLYFGVTFQSSDDEQERGYKCVKK